MKRFSPDYTGMNDDTDGDYVLYEDHVLALMAQDKLLAARGATIATQDKRIAELGHALANTEACLYARNTSLEGAEVRITKLEQKLSESRSANGRWARGLDYVGALEIRIAELEKQAAIDKTLLALADARINRELRDDFAGRAMAALIPMGAYDVEKLATVSWGVADEMLKAKGGA